MTLQRIEPSNARSQFSDHTMLKFVRFFSKLLNLSGLHHLQPLAQLLLSSLSSIVIAVEQLLQCYDPLMGLFVLALDMHFWIPLVLECKTRDLGASKYRASIVPNGFSTLPTWPSLGTPLINGLLGSGTSS